MDELMLLGEERLCPDCGTETLFLPVDAEAWVCVECDAAVAPPASAA
jgi:ribosomal protein L37AE/L43A